MSEFGSGFVGGFLAGMIVLFLVCGMMTTAANDFANRALSCMANGNTIAQCQTVLGLKNK